MGLKIKRENKTIRIGSGIALILGFIAFIIAIFEAGIGCFLTIPLFFIGLLGSILGIVPFIGPVLYYFGVNWLFSIILNVTGFAGKMNISRDIIFYSNLVFSLIYCSITTALLILFFALGRKFKVTIGRKEKK